MWDEISWREKKPHKISVTLKSYTQHERRILLGFIKYPKVTVEKQSADSEGVQMGAFLRFNQSYMG